MRRAERQASSSRLRLVPRKRRRKIRAEDGPPGLGIEFDVTVVLAQTLNTCSCERYRAPRLRVRSPIGLSDDLTAGKSYYLVEVDAVLDLLRASESSDHHLFLFDELFRGTNTVERLAAGEAVLNALPLDAQGRARHVVIAATHDGELVRMLESTYDPHHFVETVQKHGLSFDFKILPGPARTRSAINNEYCE